MNHIETLNPASPNSQPIRSSQLDVRPWWKEPYVWMVIAGPLSAVIACAITAVYILKGPDALVSDDKYVQGMAISKEIKAAQPPMQPAHTARNHSATGGKTDAKPAQP